LIQFSNPFNFNLKKFLFILIIIFFDITIYNISQYQRSDYNKKKIKTFEFNERINGNKISKVFNSTSYFKKEFFSLKEVEEQINANNLTEITTIFGSHRNVGNSLIILNKLINICERIKCKNIIIPYGLRTIIKKSIYYKKFNITIFPYSYRKMIKIDIKLFNNTIFYLKFMEESFKNRLYILREEIVNNIPKVDIKQNELVIKIRSGDIFSKCINPRYAQPPLCFYQKIIIVNLIIIFLFWNKNAIKNIYIFDSILYIENKFDKITILSNGHENPVVDRLLKMYPKIKYIEGKLEEAISFMVYAYNLVHSVSTFQHFLLYFNKNLQNLYIYEMSPFNVKNIKYFAHIMKASNKYLDIMNNKWNNTKEQLNLMLNEKCINNIMYTFFPLKKNEIL